MSKEAAAIIMNAIRERSALNCMNAPDPPAIPRGKQVYKFKVGGTYFSSGIGPIKKGVAIKIVDRYKQHGYCYYRDDRGMVHREKDLSETP